MILIQNRRTAKPQRGMKLKRMNRRGGGGGGGSEDGRKKYNIFFLSLEFIWIKNLTYSWSVLKNSYRSIQTN